MQPWDLNWETPSALPGASPDQSAAMIEADRAGRPFEVSIDSGAMQGNLQAKPAKKPWEMEWEEPAPAPKTSLWSDVKNLFGIGVDTAAQDFRELASKALPESVIRGIDAVDEWWSGKSSDALLKGEIERKQKALSPEQQAAGSKLWWDDKTGSLGDAWKDPRSYLGGVVESIPETLLTMAPSVALAKGAYAAKLGVELASGVARTEAERTAAAAAAKTAYLAGAAGEGSLAGAQSSRQVRDEILAIPEETLQKSDAYMALRKSGLTPQAARESLAGDASTKAFLLAGITTGMFGGAGDAFLARAFTRGVEGNFVGRVAKGMVSEGVLEEFPQSYLQQVSENLAKQPALPGTDATAGALNQGLGGLATGAAMGGGFGAVSRAPVAERPTPAPEEPPAPPADPFNIETDEQAQARVRDPLLSIAEATNVDEAIVAASAAVEYRPPNVAEVKAENLSLAPLEEPAASPGLDFPTEDPLKRAEAVEAAAEAEVKRMEEAAARIPYEPTSLPGPALELAPQNTAQPSGLDISPFLEQQQLAKAQAVEQAAATETAPGAGLPAAAPAFIDVKNADGAPRTFATEKGAAFYARVNRLADYRPRDTGSGWALSKPATPFQAATGPIALQGQAPAIPAPGAPAATQPAPGAGSSTIAAAPPESVPAVAPAPPASEAPAAPVPVQRFQDFVVTRSGKGRTKGETPTFKTARMAALFSKANGVPQGFVPRETPDGFVLSRPVRVRTEAQKANDATLKSRATTVQPDDALPALLRKHGGISASELTRDGGDPRSVADSMPFGAARVNGGMSLDAAAELMGQNGYDVFDEAGRVDATKARDIIQQVLDGEKVYSAQGHELRAARYQEKQQAANPSIPGGQERRSNEEQRQRVADMNPEEMRKALLTDDLTGLANGRAFKEAAPGAVQVSADADNLKWLNDNLGYEAGNELLRAIGSAFRAAKVAGYHVSGDEFTAYFDTEEQAYEAMGRVKEALDRATLEFAMPDGSVVMKSGVGLSYGIGPDQATAEIDLHRDKLDRESEGHRAARGEEPAGLRRVPASEAGRTQGAAAGVDERAAENAGANRGDGSGARAEPAQSLGNDGGDATGRNEGAAPAQPAAVQTREEPRGRDSDSPPDGRADRAEVAQPTTETPAPAGVSLSSVPPGILKKITVPVQQHHEGEGVKTVEVTAEQAVKDLDAEISAYEKLLACVRAG